MQSFRIYHSSFYGQTCVEAEEEIFVAKNLRCYVPVKSKNKLGENQLILFGRAKTIKEEHGTIIIE